MTKIPILGRENWVLMKGPDDASPEGNFARASAHMLTLGPPTPDKKKILWMAIMYKTPCSVTSCNHVPGRMGINQKL